MLKDVLKPKSIEELGSLTRYMTLNEFNRFVHSFVKDTNHLKVLTLPIIYKIADHAERKGYWNSENQSVKIRKTNIRFEHDRTCLKLHMTPPVRAINGVNHRKLNKGETYAIASFEEYELIESFLEIPPYRVNPC